MFLKILKAESENFRSFADLSFDMPGNGLRAIEGVNGSGKSNMSDLIAWILYGYIPRGGALDNVIRWGQKSCWGRLTIQAEKAIWIIERRRPTKLTLSIDGIPQELAEKEIQAKIHRDIMSDERFLLVSYLSQRREQSFFHMKDAERTKLLSVLAQTEHLDQAALKTKTEADSLDRELIKLNASLEALQTEQAGCETRIQELKDLLYIESMALATLNGTHETLCAETRANIQTLTAVLADDIAKVQTQAKANADTLAAQIVAAEAGITITDTELANCEATQATAISELNKDRLLLDVGIKNLETKIRNHQIIIPRELNEAMHAAIEARDQATKFNESQLELRRRNEQYENLAKAKDTNAANVLNGTCGECGQPLPIEVRQASAEKLKAEALEYRSKIQPEQEFFDITPFKLMESEAIDKVNDARQVAKCEPDAWRAQIAESKTALADLRTRQQALQSEPNAIKTRLAEAKTKLGTLKSKQIAEESALQTVMAALEREFAKTCGILNESVQQSEKTVEKARAKYQKLDAVLEEKLKQEKELGPKFEFVNDAIEAVAHEILKKTELQAVIKLLRATEFEGLIERISQHANELANRWTENLYGTRLSQVQEDSKGNAKLVLRPEILRNGEVVTADVLNGGHLQRIVLAYDLAIHLVGACGLPLFADEALDSIDSTGKFDILPTLIEMAKDHPVWIVDHSESLSTAIAERWIVTKTNDVSSLERMAG